MKTKEIQFLVQYLQPCKEMYGRTLGGYCDLCGSGSCNMECYKGYEIAFREIKNRLCDLGLEIDKPHTHFTLSRGSKDDKDIDMCICGHDIREEIHKRVI